MLATLIVWRINRLREQLGESADDIIKVQIESEVYVRLFIFVSIYASVFKSALSLVTLPAPGVNDTVSMLNAPNGALQI